ncbi:hypothetical protein D9M68_925830 [compost metagenome]
MVKTEGKLASLMRPRWQPRLASTRFWIDSSSPTMRRALTTICSPRAVTEVLRRSRTNTFTPNASSIWVIA